MFTWPYIFTRDYWPLYLVSSATTTIRWPLTNGHFSMTIHYWPLSTDHWLPSNHNIPGIYRRILHYTLTTDHGPLTSGHWLLTIDHLPLTNTPNYHCIGYYPPLTSGHLPRPSVSRVVSRTISVTHIAYASWPHNNQRSLTPRSNWPKVIGICWLYWPFSRVY